MADPRPTSSTSSAGIRGSVVRAPLDWIRSTYGPSAFERALRSLDPSTAAIFRGPILATTLVPIEPYSDFLDAVAHVVARQTGETQDELMGRMMREASSDAVRTLYRFLLGLLEPTTVAARMPRLASRVYGDGKVSVHENVLGSFVLRFAGRPEFRRNLRLSFGLACVVAMEMNGVRGARAVIEEDELRGGTLHFAVRVTYAAR